ncbi:MAG: hypothetical protein MUF43_14465, partial [Flavobacterium sp.]|nr:hypothetical protein [Flavobacterium sp.]
FVNSKPIQIRLDNRTNNQIKIKFDFMVDHFSKHSSLIIESFETTIEPNAVRFFDLSKHQTHLVKFRVKEITISFFKQKFIKESDYQFWIDIQPCYYSITEKREAFSNGNYGVSIIS